MDLAAEVHKEFGHDGDTGDEDSGCDFGPGPEANDDDVEAGV